MPPLSASGLFAADDTSMALIVTHDAEYRHAYYAWHYTAFARRVATFLGAALPPECREPARDMLAALRYIGRDIDAGQWPRDASHAAKCAKGCQARQYDTAIFKQKVLII